MKRLFDRLPPPCARSSLVRFPLSVQWRGLPKSLRQLVAGRAGYAAASSRTIASFRGAHDGRKTRVTPLWPCPLSTRKRTSSLHRHRGRRSKAPPRRLRPKKAGPPSKEPQQELAFSAMLRSSCVCLRKRYASSRYGNVRGQRPLFCRFSYVVAQRQRTWLGRTSAAGNV